MDRKLNMVKIKSDDREAKCLFDECCEYTSNTGEPIEFSDQNTVWSCFERWLESRDEGKFSRSCVLAVGPRSSGKSFTLFGANTLEDRGVIPRFLEKVFAADGLQRVFMQMTMVENEEIFDMLDPPSSYSAQHALTETTSFGAMNMRCKFVQSRSLDTAMEVLSLGVAAVSAFSLQRNRPFSMAGHIIITIVVNTNEGAVYTIDFVEIADLLCYTGGDVTESVRFKSTVALRDFRTDFPSKSSVLSFLLQDSIGSNISCCIISCILGTHEFLASKSNVCNLYFVSKLSEYCDSFKASEDTLLLEGQFPSRFAAELEFNQKIINQLLTILYDLDTIPNPTIKQQSADAQLRKLKRDELEKWLVSMEHGIHTARHMEMSSQKRATESLMILNEANPSTQKDTEKISIELENRTKLLFFRRKNYFLNAFARELSCVSATDIQKIYEEMPDIIGYGGSIIESLRAWVLQLGLSGEAYWKVMKVKPAPSAKNLDDHQFHRPQKKIKVNIPRLYNIPYSSVLSE